MSTKEQTLKLLTVTCRYREEVLSKETVPLEESTSLRLHTQPKEPQVTRDPLRRPTLLERQEKGKEQHG